MMKKDLKLLCIMILLQLSTACNSQEIHPYKQAFADFQSWSPTTPADINFNNFRPYRAVYRRTYTSHVTGKAVNDHVIMTAQRVYWYGKSVILFEYHDAGSPEYVDTNARTQFYYLDEKTLKMYFAVGPKAGTPEDYTTVRVSKDKIATSRITTATGEVDFKELETSDAVFGFRQLRFLMWGAMDLKLGDKIKLYPVFNPINSTLIPSIGIVKEQAEYTTPDNKKHHPFIIENTNNGDTPVVNKFYIINEAPYLLAHGLYNADEKEIYRWWLKLESFEYLK